MFIFRENIEPREHDEFVKNHPLCALLQSSSWASVKDNWDHAIVGVEEDGQLVGSSLVLIKRLPWSLTMMYIPRGPIMDYENKELVAFYLNSLKKWAKKYHCLFIKFDPGIRIREFLVKDKDKIPYQDNVQTIIRNIEYGGGRHLGFTIDMMDTIQPRFQMGVHKCDDFSKYVQKDVRKSKNAALRKHVEVKRYGIEMVDVFSDLMHQTEVRKGVALRNRDYFKKLMEVYQDHAYLFLCSVDPTIRGNEVKTRLQEIENELKQDDLSLNQIDRLEIERKNLTEEWKSLEEVLQKYDSTTYIAGALMIGFGNTVEMLYAGMNEDFKSFKPQFLSHFIRFQYVFEQGYEYACMGGVEGTLDDGLTGYKSKFNALVSEYIGEFDLPVNHLLYRLSRMAYTIRKKRKL